MGIALQIVRGLAFMWTCLFFFMALVMSTGLADEPGDTNGGRRFLLIFVIFVVPGIAVVILCTRILKQNKEREALVGFPVIQKEPAADGGDVQSAPHD